MTPIVRRIRDQWIALRCRAGESGAFGDLIAEMERPLLYYLTKLLRNENDALDVLQGVWIRAMRGIRRLEDPGSLRSWLYQSAHGLAIDHIRRDSAQRRAEINRAQHSPEVSDDEDPHFDHADAAALHAAIDELDLDHREAIVLHFLDDLSIAEISRVIGCPEGTVKSRIHYAKRSLRDALVRGGHAN